VLALEREVDRPVTGGLVRFLYAAVCALCLGPNVRRSMSRWFLLGLLFGPIAAIGMLVRNPRDRGAGQ
jgi:hypothetical protein